MALLRPSKLFYSMPFHFQWSVVHTVIVILKQERDKVQVPGHTEAVTSFAVVLNTTATVNRTPITTTTDLHCYWFVSVGVSRADSC